VHLQNVILFLYRNKITPFSEEKKDNAGDVDCQLIVEAKGVLVKVEPRRVHEGMA